MPNHTYSIALHLEDTAGSVVAQADYPLPGDEYACRSTNIDVHNLPSGEYMLLLAVYNPSTGERLQAINETTGETGDRLPLGSVVIEER